MKEQSTKEPTISLTYAYNACLAVDFDSSGEVVSEYLDGPVPHSYPRMLTLGTLLVEIARDGLRTPHQSRRIGRLRQCITQDHVQALQIIKEDLAFSTEWSLWLRSGRSYGCTRNISINRAGRDSQFKIDRLSTCAELQAIWFALHNCMQKRLL